MPTNLKFPPSVEIKRVIAAVTRVCIEIASIEIHPRKIIIHPKSDESTPVLGDYDHWKMSEGQDTSRVRHADEEFDARPGKSGD